MAFEKENLISCSEFEDSLSEYLEKTLDGAAHKAVAAHAMQCPLCHSLLNEVKESLTICHSLAEMDSPLTRLEARILANTVPNASIACEEFEEHLTDYLDGFLPAKVFHRWERHAVLCDDCTDLPGSVVRSLAAVITYKAVELPVPEGLHQRILQETTGSAAAIINQESWLSRLRDLASSIRLPIAVPQLAPVAMMLMFAFLFISQGVSADGSLSDIYSKSVQIAEQSYRQSSDAFRGGVASQQNSDAGGQP